MKVSLALVIGIYAICLCNDAIAIVYTYDSIQSRVIRDTNDDGTPDLVDDRSGDIQPIMEVDERQEDARRGIYEFELDNILDSSEIYSAKLNLYQHTWPNDPINYYIFYDDDGQIDISDWHDFGSLDSGTFSRSPSGVDSIDITSILISMVNQGYRYFRLGLRMNNQTTGHALFQYTATLEVELDSEPAIPPTPTTPGTSVPIFNRWWLGLIVLSGLALIRKRSKKQLS